MALTPTSPMRKPEGSSSNPPQLAVTVALLEGTQGMTQTDLAARLGLGRVALIDRLNGRTRWTLEDAVNIANLLDVTLDQLTGHEVAR